MKHIQCSLRFSLIADIDVFQSFMRNACNSYTTWENLLSSDLIEIYRFQLEVIMNRISHRRNAIVLIQLKQSSKHPL